MSQKREHSSITDTEIQEQQRANTQLNPKEANLRQQFSSLPKHTHLGPVATCSFLGSVYNIAFEIKLNTFL